jgi:hypothetical protein
MEVGDYTIVTGESDRDLIDSVMIHIHNGWQPVGGAVPTKNQDGVYVFMQTLIRPKISGTPARS